MHAILLSLKDVVWPNAPLSSRVGMWAMLSSGIIFHFRDDSQSTLLSNLPSSSSPLSHAHAAARRGHATLFNSFSIGHDSVPEDWPDEQWLRDDEWCAQYLSDA